MNRVRIVVTTAVALLAAAHAAAPHGSEIELRHANDLFSGSAKDDDLYTATVGIAGTTRGWTIDLEEFIFTDRDNGLRFDETFLTVARDLLPGDAAWRLRARVGVAHVGEGLFGEGLQNFVHDLLNEPEVNLPYVADERTHGFARLLVERPFPSGGRVTWTPSAEAETAGFKRHLRAGVRADWVLGGRFSLGIEGGWRWTRSGYAPLRVRVDESDPAYAAGVSFARYVEIRWSTNDFGTADRHWSLLFRIPLGPAAAAAATRSRSPSRAQRGTVVSNTPFRSPSPLGRKRSAASSLIQRSRSTR